MNSQQIVFGVVVAVFCLSTGKHNKTSDFELKLVLVVKKILTKSGLSFMIIGAEIEILKICFVKDNKRG